MRSFVVAGICLMLASSAMAATVVTLEARGIGPVVNTSVDGTSIILDVMIDSDQPMSAAGFGFDAPAGVTYAPMADFYGLSVYNYGDMGVVGVSPPSSTAGWSVAAGDANQLPGGELDSIPADGSAAEMSTLFGDVNAVSGLFGWLEVTLVEGDYTIDIKGGVADAGFVGIPGVEFRGLQVIVPEPASAMLLLLGVPFLRRRR